MNLADLEAKARAATPGPWHHVNPGVVLPKQRTVHGPVPAERVDYVSTWAGQGTPPGHRVIIPQLGRGCEVRSNDMAFIAAASPEVVLEMIERERELEAEVERRRSEADAMQAKAENYRKRLRSEGVCMSCIDGAYEPCGCTDCFNTGYDGGQSTRERALTEANAALIAENERLKAPRRDAMIERSEEDWQRLEYAIVTQTGWKVGRILSEQDISDLHFINECNWEDEEAATDAYHRGLEHGLRERGGDALLDAETRVSKQMAKVGVERALRIVAEHDRDVLTAENARLREALKECVEVLALVEHPRNKDPTYGDEVEALGRRIGFGALMSSAQASWRTYLAERGGPVGGEHVAGPAQATITRALSIARQALEQS